MNVNHIIQVHNEDPVGELREFLADWWNQYRLDALLAPVELPQSQTVAAQVISDPAGLSQVNPFAPLLLSNAARDAVEFIEARPGERLALLLRPCELRAFIELNKRGRARSEVPVVLIGVDCLGTYPPDEYARRVQMRSVAGITREVLHDATEGGLRPRSFRNACQVCDWPAPRSADLTIGTIGVDSDQFLVLIARDEEVDASLGLPSLIDAPASEYQVSHRETVVGAVADLRAVARRKLLGELNAPCRFGDLGCLMAWFSGCDLCANCLAACPVYEGELDGWLGRTGPDQISRAPLADLVAISRWLASCSGCGMCEEHCGNDVPLTLLISSLSHRIRGEMKYSSGDASQGFPWVHQPPQ